MPQMNPMSWVSLFSFFILMFYTLINLWSFHALTSPNIHLYNKSLNNKSWKW